VARLHRPGEEVDATDAEFLSPLYKVSYESGVEMEAQLFLRQFPDNMDTEGAILFVALMCVVAAVIVLVLMGVAFAACSVTVFAIAIFGLINSFLCGVCGYTEPVMSFEVAVLVVLVISLSVCFVK